MTRTNPKRWFVEWCSELAFYEDGSADRDSCKMRTRGFATREEAEKFAKEVWPQTHNTFGIVTYWEAEFTAYDEDDAARYPHAGFWEAIGEHEEVYEGDD